MKIRKLKKISLFFMISSILVLSGCSSRDEPDMLKGPYLGQKPPRAIPEIFAPGIVSTSAEEFGCTFSPDGNEFYFTRKTVAVQGRNSSMTIMVCRQGKTKWSKPEVAPFCTDHNEGEPSFSPTGQFVLYGRLIELANGTLEPRILMAERKENDWGKPKDLIAGMFASINENNVIYYTDVSQGIAQGDIYRASYIQGKLKDPEKLGGAINSLQQDAHPYITPDGDMLLFDSNRPGGFGDNDLYICFKQNKNTWSVPVNMGPIINTPEYEALPYLSFDGKYLFFFRKNNIYWIAADFLAELY